MTNSIQIMRAMIRRTWVGLNAKPQSAWNKRYYHWSNLPKGWGSPTLLHSTSGRMYGWLGFLRRSIGPLLQDRANWNSCEMAHWTGRRRLQKFWRLLRPGCLCKVSIMLNCFSATGWRCFWTYVQVRFRRRGRRESEATSDRRRIRERARVQRRYVTSHSSQLQLSLLWFIECRTATMTRHPTIYCKLRSQMWGTGRSWLISSKKIVSWNNQAVWWRYTNATWHRKNWTKSIWDYTHPGKWWTTLYIVRYHTTVPIQMPSSWNWDTMWN